MYTAYMSKIQVSGAEPHGECRPQPFLSFSVSFSCTLSPFLRVPFPPSPLTHFYTTLRPLPSVGADSFPIDTVRGGCNWFCRGMMHRFLGTSPSPLTLVPDFLFLAWTHPLPCNVDTSLLKRFLQNYTLSDSPDYVTGYVWSNIKSNEPQILKSTAYATKDYDIVN